MNTNTGSTQQQLMQLFQNLGGVVSPGMNSNTYSVQGWLAHINAVVSGGGGVGNGDIIVACTGTTQALTTGTAKETFRAERAFTLTGVKASLTSAATGSTVIIDINLNGVSVLGTKLSIDASELTSTTAASAATITTSAIPADGELTIDIDQIGATLPGTGLKITLQRAWV